MFKVTALIGLLCGCSMLGAVKSLNLKERIRLLEDYLKLMLEIKGNINYFRQPLVNIRPEKGSDCFSEAYNLFNGISFELKQKEAEISEIWAKNVDRIYRDTQLKPDDIELFKYAGSFIGQTDYENHLARFEYLEERLEKQINAARDNYNKQGPLYRKIGLFAGVLAVIIFI